MLWFVAFNVTATSHEKRTHLMFTITLLVKAEQVYQIPIVGCVEQC